MQGIMKLMVQPKNTVLSSLLLILLFPRVTTIGVDFHSSYSSHCAVVAILKSDVDNEEEEQQQ